MSYLVLARKWRPRSFDTLVGQDHVVRALRTALDTGRLHHAWLFTGTRGVGKTSLSRILAKALNCEQGVTSTPCGECDACRGIDADRYVDYLELDAASNRGVEDMSRLLDQAVYAPTAGRFKVYMIDEVHMLTGHAFNAMLKTLEEPPPHVKFILATTDPQKIPVTVLSRCLQFNLKQMPPPAVADHLAQVLEAEGVPAEPLALRLLGQAARGSMRDALSLTDQAIAYAGGHVTEAAVRDMLGVIDQQYLVRLLRALVAGDGQGAVSVADELATRGLSYAGALDDLAQLLAQVAMAQRIPGLPSPDHPQAEAIRELATAISPDAVQLFYSVCLHSRAELALAPDEHAGFVMACLRMLAFVNEGGGAGSTSETPPTGAGVNAAAGASHVSASEAAGSPHAAHTPTGSAGPLPDAGVKPEAEQGVAAARAALAAARAANAAEARSKVDSTAAAPNASTAPEAPASAEARSSEKVRTNPEPHTDPAPKNTEPRAGQAARVEPEVRADGAAPQSQPLSASEPRAEERPERGAYTSAAAAEPPWEDIPPPWEVVEDPVRSPADAVDSPAEAKTSAGRGAESKAKPGAASNTEPSAESNVGPGAEPNVELSAAPKVASNAEPSAETMKAGQPEMSWPTTAQWPALAAALPVRGLASELARQSEWLRVEDNTIVLKVPTQVLIQTPTVERLRQALTEHFGRALQVRFEVGATGTDTAHAVAQSERDARQREAEAAIAQDPFVHELLTQFNGQIVPGSIRPQP